MNKRSSFQPLVVFGCLVFIIILGTSTAFATFTGTADGHITADNQALWLSVSGTSRILRVDLQSAAVTTVAPVRLAYALVSAGSYLYGSDGNTVTRIDKRQPLLFSGSGIRRTAWERQS